MRLYVDGISALHAWRHDGAVRVHAGDKSQSTAFRRLPQNAQGLQALATPSYNLGDSPLHVACGSDVGRVGRSSLRYRVHAEPLTRGMFCKIDNKLYIASPEQCFLEAANSLGRVQLVQLGMELCGTYSLAFDEPNGFIKWKDASSLTACRKLKTYVERSAGRHGYEKARIALKYVQDGSASPAETRLYLRLHMPKRYGGYALKEEAELNPRFKFDNETSRALRRASVSPDIYYPGHKVVIEYDSRLHHSGSEKIEADSRRRNLLLGFGIRVFTVTAGIAANFDEFDRFVFELRQALGVKNAKRFAHDDLRRHADLVAELNATSMLVSALRLELTDPKAAAWALPSVDREILREINANGLADKV